MSGKTDPEIVGEYLSAMGLDDPDLVAPVLRHSEALLAEAAAAGRLAAGERVCPGTADVLARVADDPRVVSTLLTGNIEPNALVKVAAFGLDRWLDPTVGAYGSDASDRNLLVPIALRRLSHRRGVDVPAADAWVIGDTPRDLACARAAGARCLLVATGRYGVDELAALQPDAVLEDLQDGPAVVQLLTGDL
jgi:phosphoglycolate phosphatase-like HAD superfamily hydrolase